MPSPSEIVRRHVDAALAEAGAAGIAPDQVGRSLLDMAVDLLGRGRSPQDVADELTFVARNIADEEDHSFMRP